MVFVLFKSSAQVAQRYAAMTDIMLSEDGVEN